MKRAVSKKSEKADEPVKQDKDKLIQEEKSEVGKVSVGHPGRKV